VAAAAIRDVAAHRVTSLDASINLADAGATAAGSGKLGAVALKLTGSEGSGTTASRLAAALSSTGSVLDLGARGLLPADADVNATLVYGSNKIQVDRLLLKTGRSSFDFGGSIGPKPATGVAGEEPS
ncbi:hypothetical protein EN855_034315, partial [Mesorhizobium sp. M1C.F.Ca.ET.212.01.1.1]